STIFTQTNQYRVVLEVKPEFQIGPEALSQIYVPATNAGAAAAVPSTGANASAALAAPGAGVATAPTQQGTAQVPLTSIARISEHAAPLVVNHLGQFPAATISFNLAHGASLGDAVDEIQKA